MPETLTPKSARWDEFCNALDATLRIWGCDARTHRHAKDIMAKMGNVDIEASLEFFEEHGGYCDCEILLNVDTEHDAYHLNVYH